MRAKWSRILVYLAYKWPIFSFKSQGDLLQFNALIEVEAKIVI